MSDAVPGTGGEGKVRVRVPLGAVLRCEPLGNKAIRIGKYLGITVEEEGGHDDVCSGGNQFIFDNNFLANDSVNKRILLIDVAFSNVYTLK